MDSSNIETGKEFDNPMSMSAVFSLGVADTANIRTSPNNNAHSNTATTNEDSCGSISSTSITVEKYIANAILVSNNDNDAPTSEFTAAIQTHNPLIIKRRQRKCNSWNISYQST